MSLMCSVISVCVRIVETVKQRHQLILMAKLTLAIASLFREYMSVSTVLALCRLTIALSSALSLREIVLSR